MVEIRKGEKNYITAIEASLFGGGGDNNNFAREGEKISSSSGYKTTVNWKSLSKPVLVREADACVALRELSFLQFLSRRRRERERGIQKKKNFIFLICTRTAIILLSEEKYLFKKKLIILSYLLE